MINSSNNFTNSTLIDILRSRAIYQPKQVAYTFLQDGETERSCLTYQELDQQARAIAAELQSLKLVGERALLLYPPGLEFIAAFFGCLYAGVVAVPAYPPRANQSLSRLQAITASARATIALTTETVLSNGATQKELQALRWIATDKVKGDLALDWKPLDVNGDTLAFLQYTSGSTATPKGVMVSHDNLLHNQKLIQQAMQHTEKTIFVGWLPLFHDMGLIGNMLQPLYLGIPCILMPPAAFLQRPLRWLQAISRYKATTSGGPNFAYDLCVRKITDDERETLDLSSWEVAFNGAEPVCVETLERFTAAFKSCGFRHSAFYPCYGMAETTLIVSGGLKAAPPVFQTIQGAGLEQNRIVAANREEVDATTLVGCGQPIQDLQVVIAHPDTCTCCAPDEIGEIWVSGSSVAQGYWGQVEETKNTFQAYLKDTGEGPFLRTGDLGFLRSGELFVTGRLKDLIVIRGRNHYPQDIERTVEQSHPALQLAGGAAFSILFDSEERLVVAQEVKRSYLRKLDVEEVVRAVRQAIAENHELQVHGILLLKPGSIPKTSSGKLQRHAARAGFLNDSLNVVASSILKDCDLIQSEDSLKRETILAIEQKDRQPLLETYLQKQVAQILRVNLAQLHLQQPLSTVGIDSLMAIELKNHIETNFGVVLPITSFLEGYTIAQLASEILILLPDRPNAILPGLTDVEHSLSYGQRSLWFLHQLAPESPAYNIASAVRIKADLNIPAFKRAFQQLVDRHPCLRTTFIAPQGKPVQQIHDDVKVCFQQEDAFTWSEEFLNTRLVEEAQHPFNLEQGPLMRVNLFKRSPQEPILLLSVHHIIADFWSLAVMLQELGILYQAEKKGIPTPLTPLTLQYTDYAVWQSEMLASSEGERLWAYWRHRIAGELPVLNLPTDRPRPSVQTYRGASVPFKLSRKLTQKLQNYACDRGATLYMALLAVFQVLLYRYTGQEDLLVGSPTAGRNRAELAGLVGYFVNPVVLRADLSGNPTFEEFLVQVRSRVLDAFNHQDYPFAMLVEQLQPIRDLSRSPLFQVMFILQKAYLLHEEGLTSFALGETGAQMNLAGLELESLALEKRVAQVDLTLMVAEVEGELAATFEYNTDLFESATISRMAEHFQILLEGIVANPQQHLKDLPLLSAVEQQLLLSWNDTQIDYPHNTCIHQLFEDVVERSPDAVAVVFADEHITYRELNQRANRIAHHLKQIGVGPDILVGICIERSLEMVVGLLGILKAGGAYVPLDPRLPQERICFMLADAQPSVLLTQQHLLERLPKIQIPVVCLDRGEAIALHNPSDSGLYANLNRCLAPENLAYVIYTSGSTGKPKGVQISHSALVNCLYSLRQVLGVTDQDVLLAITTITFDIAALEIFLPLMVGGTVIMGKRELAFDGVQLSNTLLSNITIMQATPTTWQLLCQAGWQGSKQLRMLCGGEALPVVLAQQLLAKGAALWNVYGPTETTIWSTAFLVEAGATMSTGRPIANTQIYLLDAHFQPVPIGVVGDVYISGDGLARGYLHRPELTGLKFIPNPWSNKPGARLYQTGDLARYLPDGNIQFLGRSDHQVKIRGLRIELGEIETVLEQHPYVDRAVVLDYEHQPGDKRLVAYIVSQPEFTQTSNDLRYFLKQKLPYYMVPSDFVLLDNLPLLPSGKINRRALPMPELASDKLKGSFFAPRNPVEEVLAGIWAEVLGLEQVSIYDNFFEIGGHSLLVTQVVSRLRDIFQFEVPLHKLFEAITVADLARAVIAYEAKPGQAEKIARVVQRIENMSAQDVRETLQKKQKG